MQTSYSADMAHATAPLNDEALAVAPAQGPRDQTQSDDTNRSGESLREQGYAKRLANVTAKLAMIGFELYPLHDETLLVARWNMSRVLPSVEAAERFLRMVGGSR